MKTAISIPDPIFASAEKMAKQLGLSRSQLFTRAMENYLRENDDEALIAKYNAAFAVADSALDPAFKRAQSKAVPREDW